MNTKIDPLQQWQQQTAQALASGGEKRIAQQHAQGKKTARERLTNLLDPNSFEEIDQLAISPYLEHPLLGDGVIAGFGTISGRRIAIFAQDFTSKGGSLGKRHAEKILKIMDIAASVGCPIIGLLDSGGARIDEGIHALAGYGSIFFRNSRLSGVIPQISVVLGPCAGGAVYSPALTDFIFATSATSHLFITGPTVIKEVLHYNVSKDELGGASMHAQRSGVVHFLSNSEEECFEQLTRLLSYLPDNYRSESPRSTPQAPQLQSPFAALPTNPNASYDMHQIIYTLMDAHSWFEVHASFAQNIIVGFARMEGEVVGIIANQPLHLAGSIDINASSKAARFIQTANNFNIPLITLVDVPGFLPGIEQEQQGIIRHGAALIAAYSNATVPKITLIVRKAFGGAYIVMSSKHLGADVVYAWPTAQIAVLGARGAVAILHKEHANNPEHLSQLEAAYAKQYLNPFIAAQAGYIDAIIDPQHTRQKLLSALAITRNKVERPILRKGPNIPL